MQTAKNFKNIVSVTYNVYGVILQTVKSFEKSWPYDIHVDCNVFLKFIINKISAFIFYIIIIMIMIGKCHQAAYFIF